MFTFLKLLLYLLSLSLNPFQISSSCHLCLLIKIFLVQKAVIRWACREAFDARVSLIVEHKYREKYSRLSTYSSGIELNGRSNWSFVQKNEGHLLIIFEVMLILCEGRNHILIQRRIVVKLCTSSSCLDLQSSPKVAKSRGTL